MQPRIYVDIDDVLCETGKAYPNLLETHFGKSATFASMHAFDLGVSFSLKPDELQRLLALAHEDDVLKQLRAVPGARKGLDQFRSMGYDIAIVTGRPPSTEEATRWWLQKQRMPHQQLIFVDKYGRADPDAFDDRVVTLEGLRGMTFSYAVEDSWDMAIFLAERVGVSVGLLDRPWNKPNRNRVQRPTLDVQRCANWVEIHQHFLSQLAR